MCTGWIRQLYCRESCKLELTVKDIGSLYCPVDLEETSFRLNLLNCPNSSTLQVSARPVILSLNIPSVYSNMKYTLEHIPFLSRNIDRRVLEEKYEKGWETNGETLTEKGRWKEDRGKAARYIMACHGGGEYGMVFWL
jgi:hypothetical protein